MPATVAGIHLGPDTHANRPAANASGLPVGSLYSCSDHSLIYQTDGSAWSTWATLGSSSTADHNHTAAGGDGGDLDSAVIGDKLIFTEAAAPATPGAGTAAVYVKTDGRVYSMDDTGAEYGPFDAAGAGGGPLLYADSLALHANGTDFADDTLADVSNSGIAVPGDVTAVTTEPYDDTCLDIVFAAQGDRVWIAAPAGDFTAYLTFHGITNSTPSPSTAIGAMMALVITDDSGTGTGVSLYTDGAGYMWGVSSHVYSATGNAVGSYGGWHDVVPPDSSNWPMVYRLAKSGTTITGGISFNGGASWKTATRADSTTFTRVCVTRLFNAGGTNPTMRVGRLNIV